MSKSEYLNLKKLAQEITSEEEIKILEEDKKYLKNYVRPLNETLYLLITKNKTTLRQNIKYFNQDYPDFLNNEKKDYLQALYIIDNKKAYETLFSWILQKNLTQESLQEKQNTLEKYYKIAISKKEETDLNFLIKYYNVYLEDKTRQLQILEKEILDLTVLGKDLINKKYTFLDTIKGIKAQDKDKLNEIGLYYVDGLKHYKEGSLLHNKTQELMYTDDLTKLLSKTIEDLEDILNINKDIEKLNLKYPFKNYDIAIWNEYYIENYELNFKNGAYNSLDELEKNKKYFEEKLNVVNYCFDILDKTNSKKQSKFLENKKESSKEEAEEDEEAI